jgi:hemoglobin
MSFVNLALPSYLDADPCLGCGCNAIGSRDVEEAEGYVESSCNCARPRTAAGESLCKRLGGSGVVAAVVKSFLTKMRKDDADKLGRFWLYRGDDGVAREEQLIVDFVQSTTGCGGLYVGRSLTGADWNRTAELRCTTMTEFSVPTDLQEEVFGLVPTTRGDIVECEAETFGCKYESGHPFRAFEERELSHWAGTFEITANLARCDDGGCGSTITRRIVGAA